MEKYAEYHFPQYKCTVRIHKGSMPEEEFKEVLTDATIKLVKAQMRAHKAARKAAAGVECGSVRTGSGVYGA
jgi:hypothetical protein